MSASVLNLHLVSDSTGETLHTVARATVAQFEHVRVAYHHWNLVRSRQQLKRVLDGIAADPGPVLSSVVDRMMRRTLDDACVRMALPAVNVLDPVLSMLQDALGQTMRGKPGMQHVLDEEYYRRIDAMHYVLAHDDGQAAGGLAEADVVLVGVSRTSKTPTSFYLANRGVKAANVPLVPELVPAPELFSVRRPVIGLTIDPRALMEIRRHRLRAMTPDDPACDHLALNGASYVDARMVRDEVVWARRLCLQHGWPVIDVTRRSIEETAAEVISRRACRTGRIATG